MLRKFLAVAALLMLAVPSQAGVFSSLLSFNGTEDIVADDSVGIFKTATAGVLAKGDLIQGMISFTPIDGNGVPAGSSVIGAYSLEVDTINTAKTIATFKAASGADSLGAILAAAGVDLNGVSMAGAGLAVLESSTITVDRTDFAGPPFGFTGASGATGADFKTVASLSVIEHLVTRPLGDITDLTTPPSIFDPIGFLGTYGVIDHSFGGSTIFLPVTNVVTTTVGDAKIEDGTIKSPDADAISGGWAFVDDGNYVLNPVPEPASLAIFAVLGLGAVGRRRRA